jgi:Transposase DDE domain
MNPGLCRECPLLAHCRVQKDKSTNEANGRVQFRSDAPRAAQRRRHEQTAEFRDTYRWRSGIESTNSGLKRRLGLNRLRVQGMPAVKLCVMLKLTAWNMRRAVALRLRARLQAGSLLAIPA